MTQDLETQTKQSEIHFTYSTDVDGYFRWPYAANLKNFRVPRAGDPDHRRDYEGVQQNTFGHLVDHLISNYTYPAGVHPVGKLQLTFGDGFDQDQINLARLVFQLAQEKEELLRKIESVQSIVNPGGQQLVF